MEILEPNNTINKFKNFIGWTQQQMDITEERQ